MIDLPPFAPNGDFWNGSEQVLVYSLGEDGCQGDQLLRVITAPAHGWTPELINALDQEPSDQFPDGWDAYFDIHWIGASNWMVD